MGNIPVGRCFRAGLSCYVHGKQRPGLKSIGTIDIILKSGSSNIQRTRSVDQKTTCHRPVWSVPSHRNYTEKASASRSSRGRKFLVCLLALTVLLSCLMHPSCSCSWASLKNKTDLAADKWTTIRSANSQTGLILWLNVLYQFYLCKSHI